MESYTDEFRIVYTGIKRGYVEVNGSDGVNHTQPLEFGWMNKLNRYMDDMYFLLAIHKIRFGTAYFGTNGATDTDITTVSTIDTSDNTSTRNLNRSGVLARKELVRVSHNSAVDESYEYDLISSVANNNSPVSGDDWLSTTVIFPVSEGRVERFEHVGDTTLWTYNPPIILNTNVLHLNSKVTGRDGADGYYEQALVHYSIVSVPFITYLLAQEDI